MIYPDTLDRAVHADILSYEKDLIDEWIAEHPDVSATSIYFMRTLQTYLDERIQILTKEAE